MSTVTVAGTLILNGNLTCNDDINITSTGIVTSVPDTDTKKTFYSYQSDSYITANGQGRTITSTTGNITVSAGGTINGQGFISDEGPGCNSVLIDNLGNTIPGYGATHAGLGYVTLLPGMIYDISEDHTLTSEDLDNQRVKLNAVPINPTETALNVIYGGAQIYGIDFTIDGYYLTWIGTSFGSMIAEGDTLRVIYRGNTTPIAPTPRPRYGHWETPVSLGSGGGFYHDPTSYLGEDTYGGGAIKIEALSGIVQIDGTINMDGQNGNQAGGGAGGSIWIIGWDIIITGSVTAKGGSTLLLQNGGGGGGGYISLWYNQSYAVSGNLSVAGGINLYTLEPGAGDGKIFIKQIEPYLEDKFTGHILNTKWWDATNLVTTDNQLVLTSPQDDFNFPVANSNFSISGKNITASADYVPVGTMSENFHADFLLYSDDQNWVGMSRRPPGLFGISSVDGLVSSSGISFDYTNVSFRILKRDSTFSFQYYDSTSTPQTLYTDVHPELADLSFNVKFSVTKEPSTMFRTDTLRLTTLDISRKYMELDGTPADSSAVALNTIWGTSQNYGTDFYSAEDKVKWDTPDTTALANLLSWGDILRANYGWVPPAENDSTVGFDNVAIYEGVIAGAETRDPVIYVDSDFGSDSSEGRQLSPLRNLFVATAWAKRGGTVVLYDGTYNPTEVSRKDLTIRGAEGIKPLITSVNVQDTTGSGWETNAISFFGCQGIVDNVQITGSAVGVKVEDGNFDIARTEISDATTGMIFIKCDPVIARNRISVSGIALDFTSCLSPYVYSNVIYDSSVAVHAGKSPNITISSNTFDTNSTHIVLDSSSPGIVASNNLTNGNVGLQASVNSYVSSFNNNYYGTTTRYSRAPDTTANDQSTNPLYSFPFGKDFHLDVGSPDIGAGLLDYDNYLIDFDGASRIDGTFAHPDIGAFEYIDASHPAGDYYVASSGDDFWNSGTIGQPYRTVDKAMLVADAMMHIDAGHYDSYYLSLNSNFDGSNSVNFYIYTSQLQHFVTYRTLSASDVSHGYVSLGGFPLTEDDARNIAINVVGGPAQIYGTDYVIEYGSILWKDMVLDGFLAMGDTLRIIFQGALQQRALETLILHSRYSNYEPEKAVFVSPSGSDSTMLGGDGTNTGGNGTFALPYRTVSMALTNSVDGDNIVMIAGEYPLFQGVDNRILVPAIDQTSVLDSENRRYLMDFFAPQDFRLYGTTLYDSVPWAFSYAGKSYATAGAGFLSFTYDGTNMARAESTFEVVNDLEVQADLRNSLDPLNFVVSSSDNTMMVSFNDGSYVASITTGGKTYNCHGNLLGDSTHAPRLVTEYISLTAIDIANKYVPLSFIPDPSDCTNIALNIIGGVPQIYGLKGDSSADFYIEDGKIKWDSMDPNNMPELDPGEVLRVIYSDKELSIPVRFSLSLVGQRFTIKAYEGRSWRVLNIRDMVGTYHGPWDISFFMDTPTAGISHDFIFGRGFVSRFLAIGESFMNTDLDKALVTSTERKNVVLYKDRF
jgi:hypothetical protein